MELLLFQAVFTLVTRVKVFDVVRVDVRNGLSHYVDTSIGSQFQLMSTVKF